ncbi:MAG: tRNA pseudouridine(55) synthase TruB [Treponema sp.]|jgi:tRNA pseudouridine55 synthase|nr:tRNA pseudouridine(55) synthase TruB [Treponema sp.]
MNPETTGRPLAGDCNGGFLLLKKSPGVTSFESLNIVKKALRTGKVGHTGTLDKFASGLLIVLTGRALKLAPWFSLCDKEYEGCIRFGFETDTLDPEGSPVAEGRIPSREDVEAALSGFRGCILQAPPAYSAVHVDGQRASDLARQGRGPEMKKRPVTVYSLEILSWSPPSATVRVCCSAGTYIRSLARDIALAAGTRAHLSALVRTRIGGFRLDRAFDPEAHKGTGNADPGIAGDLAAAVRPVRAETFGLLGLPAVFAKDETVKSLIQGRLSGPDITDLGLPSGAEAAGVFSIKDGKEELAAVLEQKSGKWGFGRVFAQN